MNPIADQALPFNEFLPALFSALAREKVLFCVLRNYQGFPETNLGNDIDLLIAPPDLPRAVRAIRSLGGVRIVGYSERPYVANLFLEGIERNSGSRALEVDLDIRMSWKGLPPFLSTKEILEAAIPRTAGNTYFLVPSPVHEAIISLLMSLFIGGWLKEKYFPQVQETFTGNRSEVIAALAPRFGSVEAIRLADAVISGDRPRILGMIGRLRKALLLRSLLRQPLRSLAAIIHHHASELCIRHSPQLLEQVAFLAPSAPGQSSIIQTLLPRLQSFAVKVESKPAARPGSGLVAGLLCWMEKEWLSLFEEKKNLTLRVRTGYGPLFHGAVGQSDPPVWLIRLIGTLTPSPALCIRLAEGAGENSAESRADLIVRHEACQAFLKTRKRLVVLDASLPPETVVECAYGAIVDALVQQAAKKLNKRFR